MPRHTVWVSEEVEGLAAQLDAINWSEALAIGVRALASCDHEHLACAGCGHRTSRTAITGDRLAAFYRTVIAELNKRSDAPGYPGAARIVQRVATDHQVPGVRSMPVQRATSAQLEARADQAHEAEVTPLPREADSRRRHPTALPIPANHAGPQPAPPHEETKTA